MAYYKTLSFYFIKFGAGGGIYAGALLIPQKNNSYWNKTLTLLAKTSSGLNAEIIQCYCRKRM